MVVVFSYSHPVVLISKTLQKILRDRGGYRYMFSCCLPLLYIYNSIIYEIIIKHININAYEEHIRDSRYSVW